MRKKLKPTEPANSSVRPWKGGVPIYKVQFGGGANYLLATDTRTALVHADHEAAPLNKKQKAKAKTKTKTKTKTKNNKNKKQKTKHLNITAATKRG